MSDNEIRDLLIQLNNRPEPGRDSITATRINDRVFHAEVVTYLDRSLEGRGGPKARPFSFYFIRSDKGKFVGAVHDAIGDLQWYVLPRYRGRGLMRDALRTTILPHIATTGRRVQSISISRGLIGSQMFTVSQRLALSVGFQLVGAPEGDDLNFEMDLTALPVLNTAPMVGQGHPAEGKERNRASRKKG